MNAGGNQPHRAKYSAPLRLRTRVLPSCVMRTNIFVLPVNVGGTAFHGDFYNPFASRTMRRFKSVLMSTNSSTGSGGLATGGNFASKQKAASQARADKLR